MSKAAPILEERNTSLFSRMAISEKRAGWSAVGAQILVISIFVLGLYLTSRYSYLLFHSLVEVFTIIIACGIFMLVWNSRGFSQNSYLTIIGIAYLSGAALDLLHTLSYQGMGVIQTGGANTATQFWVASRLLQSISFLIAPFFIHRKPNAELVLLAYGVITLVAVDSILAWNIFPTAYIDGVGLTPFKKASEIAVSLFLAGSILLLWLNRRDFDPYVLKLFILSLGLNICAEIAFSVYRNVYGFYNLAGHLFRLVSYYVIYKAIIEVGFVKPYALLFRDLKAHEKALWQQTLELQMRNEDLDAYAHTVAHDLQNPLAAVITATNTLLLPDLPAKERGEFLHGILTTSFNMKSIIDNLLLLAEVRKVDIPLAPVDMGLAVKRARDRVASLIRESQAEVHFPPAWPAARGYNQWVEEVWVNYLSNAIKYGGKPPCLELGATPQPDGKIRFWLHDNGPGISPEGQARLFKPFARLSQLNSGGHGLGLSIVRRIIEKLGGQVGVESEIGRGSTFYFILDAAE